MDQKKVGQFLKELRKEKGITQEELAEKLGASGRTISRWETGANMPDISLLVEIADFYEVDVRELIEGERKKEMMNNDIRETATRMADYAEAEKGRLLKFAQIIGIIGVIVLTAVMIIQSVNYEPSVPAFITMLLTFVALVLMVVMTLYVTGVLRKIVKGKFSTAIIVAVIALFIIALKRLAATMLLLTVLFIDVARPMSSVDGVERYDKQYFIEEFSGDLTSHFFLFPDDLSETLDADFHYKYKVGLLDTDASFFLVAEYSDEDFRAEVERISHVTCTVPANDTQYTQAVMYDEEMYNYPAYIAMDGYASTYEYALIDEAGNRIIYVLLSYPEYAKLLQYRDFLKKDPTAYVFSGTSSLENFCIYAVRSYDIPDIEMYVTYDESMADIQQEAQAASD
ncbi:MAG: helix-turn-helix domain-containing protein [Lachnospiraceae bacterium]|nr:helix-turn-helix domain-containing protein [Lachnospiraceae bacterium]